MKKTTQLRQILLTLIFFQSFCMIAQNLKPFTTRHDRSLKGDMLLIGNNILSRHSTNSYNGTGYNSDFYMTYVDTDNDSSTFSSSSATLAIPNPACYKIVYAGLYWGAILQEADRRDIEKVKLKLPTGAYHDINGQLIYDANRTPIGRESNKPYACYADITSLVSGQANAQGEYTVANVKSSIGSNGGTGLSAGWSIFIVYEDPKLPAKYITSFDGFSGIGSAQTLGIPVSGFKTIPVGPVRAKFAFAALEGDGGIPGDYLEINRAKISAVNARNQVIRPANNFFNSSVTYIDPATGKTDNFLNRRPASSNTLGYDAGILNVENPQNKVIPNNATSTTITLGSSQDVYFYYFNAIAVDIIEPNIVLTKLVKDAAGNDIGGQAVKLGQSLNYEIGFKNTGNDDATSFTIRDKLPDNIIFNYPADLSPLPAGVTVQNYDDVKKEIIFAVNNSLVKANSIKQTDIKFKVQVIPDCNSFTNACSNSIDNSAYATYRGSLNSSFIISDDPSVNSNTGCILVPKATNFLAGVDTCNYSQNVTLCGTSVDLIAGNGYTTYTWYSDAALTKQIGTGQTLNVKNPGTYYVYNLAAAPCLSISQSFVVTRSGNVTNNPVTPFQDDFVVCRNDGKELPHIILCGANAFREIKTNILGTTSIVWERLDTASCAAASNPDCANEDPACTWNTVWTGANYKADTAGQYRLKLNYTGGCYSIFYFNVYTNLLNPTEKHHDIFCGKPGNITIGGFSSGYEYSLDGINYVPSNSFDIVTPGLYTAYIRQINAPANSCIFTIVDILISKPTFSVTPKITDALCYGEKGSIEVDVAGARGQYSFIIYNDRGQEIGRSGLTNQSNYTFSNLKAGQNYTIEVSTDDGCKDTVYAYIQDYWGQPFTAIAALIEPLTACNTIKGKIKIIATGGLAPYNYELNSSGSFQNSDEFEITTPGTYDILVVDSNNCTTQTSITVTDNPKPVYTITSANSYCYNSGSGEIRVTVTNANGYTMSYSIDNGATFQNSPVFSNVQEGTYDVVVRYGLSYTPVPGQPPLMKNCEDKSQVIITGPASGISASGSVSELAGCTLSGQGGKVRITNVKGGTFPYQYSFDGGATWQATNEKDVLPGQYILKVKDALGCEYTIPYNIVLDPKPADPIITVDPPVFNCNGSATTVVTVTNSSSANFRYEYYLDGNPNTPIDSNTFTNVTSGNHTISVKYVVISVPSYSNLLIEDFGSGTNTTTAGIASAYCYHDLSKPSTCTDRRGTLEDNQYVVTKAIIPNNVNWFEFIDHTSGGSDTNGRFLAVNVGSAAGAYGILYKEPVVDVIPNQPVKVDLFVGNLLRKGVGGAAPIIRIQLVDPSGNVVAQQDTGKIADAPSDPNRNKWVPISISLDPGNNTNLTFVIRSGSLEYNGNDLAIDDISVYQIPKACGTSKDFPFVIATDKAFKASITGFKDVSCFGQNDGEVTITAENFKLPYGFDYSLDGSTWVNSKVSPVIVTGLPARNYNIQVRYDASASTCVQPIPHEVKTPPLLTISASVTSLATCIQGATITATAAGGTTPYEFELRDAAGVAVIAPFQSSGIFTNV
ncbi:hypothetical protein SAMN06265346_12738, partial [Flavobacterium hercynium]